MSTSRKSERILFLHGLESGPTGKKARYLKGNFPEISVPNLKPFPFALVTAIRAYHKGHPQVVVASSMGAVICTIMMFLSIVQCPVILLAPPFPTILNYFWGRHLSAGRGLILVHGLHDGMSFWATSMKHTHKQLHQIVVNDDHALSSLLANGSLLALISIARTFRSRAER